MQAAPSLASGSEGESESSESITYLFQFFASGHQSDDAGAGAMRRAVANGEDEEAVAAKQRDNSRIWALDQLLVLSRSSLPRSGGKGGNGGDGSRGAKAASARQAGERHVSE